MKIYIGNTNISSLYNDLSVGFKSIGHTIFTMANQGHRIQGDINFDISKSLQQELTLFDRKFPNVSRVAREHYIAEYEQKLYDHAFMQAADADLCIFIWNSFLPEWRDLPFLQKNNSKTVTCFAGSEARVLPLENIFRKMTGSPPAISCAQDLEATLRHIRYAELHADLLIGSTLAGLRPMYLPLTTILDHTNIPHRVNDRNEPVIVHAPSSRSTKGTETWLAIFSDLKAEGFKFNVRLLENIPHQDMLNILQHADILCDGLIHGGKLAREGMAAGCAVLSCIGSDAQAYQDFFLKDDNTLRTLWDVQPNSTQDRYIKDQYIKKVWYYLPEINPCIPVSPETAKDRLREILRNKEARLNLARRGRSVVEKFCSPALVAMDILDCIEQPNCFETQAKLSFHYSILYNDFIPENHEQAEIFNKTTSIVRDCEWYKNSHNSCTRHGLNF